MGAALSEGAAWEVVEGCYIHREGRFGRLMLREMIGGCGVYSSGWNARRDMGRPGKERGERRERAEKRGRVIPRDQNLGRVRVRDSPVPKTLLCRLRTCRRQIPAIVTT